MIKDHPVIAALSIACAVGVSSIALYSHYTAEPLRDRVDAQQALLEQQREEISHLRNQLSEKQQHGPSRSESRSTPRDRAGADSPGPPLTTAAVTDRVSVQSYEGFLIELTDTNAVGTSITFTFKITNTNAPDREMGIAGSDRGNMRFLGFYSSFLADGDQYVASHTSIAGDRNFLVIPGGQAVRATVRFDGIPPDLATIDHLTLRVTTGGTYPSHRLPFGPVELSR